VTVTSGLVFFTILVALHIIQIEAEIKNIIVNYFSHIQFYVEIQQEHTKTVIDNNSLSSFQYMQQNNPKMY